MNNRYKCLAFIIIWKTDPSEMLPGLDNERDTTIFENNRLGFIESVHEN